MFMLQFRPPYLVLARFRHWRIEFIFRVFDAEKTQRQKLAFWASNNGLPIILSPFWVILIDFEKLGQKEVFYKNHKNCSNPKKNIPSWRK